jgi:hypothetical protein
MQRFLSFPLFVLLILTTVPMTAQRKVRPVTFSLQEADSLFFAKDWSQVVSRSGVISAKDNRGLNFFSEVSAQW